MCVCVCVVFAAAVAAAVAAAAAVVVCREAGASLKSRLHFVPCHFLTFFDRLW